MSASSASPALHNAHDLPPPRRLARVRREAGPRPPRVIDSLRVAAWTAALVVSCAVWGGIGLAIAALVR